MGGSNEKAKSTNATDGDTDVKVRRSNVSTGSDDEKANNNTTRRENNAIIRHPKP
jgi:hypothetical protein